MFDQVFLSQVKRSVTISNTHGSIYEYENYSLVLSFCQNKFFKKLLNYRNWTFPVVPYYAWKLEFVSNVFSIIVEKLLDKITTKTLIQSQNIHTCIGQYGYVSNNTSYMAILDNYFESRGLLAAILPR